jgi:hypothetical protein
MSTPSGQPNPVTKRSMADRRRLLRPTRDRPGCKGHLGGIKHGLDAVALGPTAVGLPPYRPHSGVVQIRWGEFKFVKQQLAHSRPRSVLCVSLLRTSFLIGSCTLDALAAGKEFIADTEHYPRS